MHILHTISEGGGKQKGSGYSWFRGTEDKTICETQITTISDHYLVHCWLANQSSCHIYTNYKYSCEFMNQWWFFEMVVSVKSNPESQIHMNALAFGQTKTHNQVYFK